MGLVLQSPTPPASAKAGRARKVAKVAMRAIMVNQDSEDGEQLGGLGLECGRYDCELKFVCSPPEVFILAEGGLCAEVALATASWSSVSPMRQDQSRSGGLYATSSLNR